MIKNMEDFHFRVASLWLFVELAADPWFIVFRFVWFCLWPVGHRHTTIGYSPKSE